MAGINGLTVTQREYAENQYKSRIVEQVEMSCFIFASVG